GPPEKRQASRLSLRSWSITLRSDRRLACRRAAGKATGEPPVATKFGAFGTDSHCQRKGGCKMNHEHNARGSLPGMTISRRQALCRGFAGAAGLLLAGRFGPQVLAAAPAAKAPARKA